MASAAFVLNPGTLTLAQLRDLVERPQPVVLDPASHGAIDRSAAVVQAVIDRGETAYGINTGFGALARTHIKDDQLTELQRRLVMSHAAGTGAPLEDAAVRAILVLKANALARGFSGIRRPV
ncbi:MAG TPA: aromatic amino acid lyase, partial [Alphaproteobacteria bacterium]|nr:aromatic amino acid lyase [Alphaproteobacteria bacterium]